MKKYLIILSLLLPLITQAQNWTQTNRFDFLPDELHNDFSQSVGISMDGNYAIVGVGAYNFDPGYVQVLYFNGANWENIAKLKSSDEASSWGYGTRLCIKDDLIVVGDQYKNGQTGITYVYVKPTSGWEDATETAILTASDAEENDLFGSSVSISDDIIVVGAVKRDTTGCAYVYEKPPGGWVNTTETAQLKLLDETTDKGFGYPVRISGDIIVVGASIEGDANGAVYIFKKDGAVWFNSTESAKLTASDAQQNQYFGSQIEFKNSLIVVSAREDNQDKGSVYVFNKPAGDWVSATENAKLTASDGAYNDMFGHSLGVGEDIIVVGAFGKAYSYSNTVYVFEKPDEGWTNSTETVILSPNDYVTGDYFGVNVDISDSIIFVGAIINIGISYTSRTIYVFEKSWDTSSPLYGNKNDIDPGFNPVIYPNPCNDIVTIVSPENVQQITITDLSGKVVLSKLVSIQKETIDITNWDSGVYNVSIQTPFGIKTGKLLKK